MDEPDAQPSPRERDGHTVQLWPSGACFPAPSGVPVLLAAEAAGIEMASSCRNGTCRTCMCRLVRGSVAYRIEWPGVLAEERAAGWMLPCVALALSDLVIASGADAHVLPVT